MRELPDPVARGKEVVVKMEAAGICGTDIESLYKPKGVKEITPGHEISGVVVDADRARLVKVGDRVVVNCHVTCGHCHHCRNGDLIFCPALSVIGFEKHGGFAEFVLVPEECCYPLPDDISFEVGCLFTDALATPYRAVKQLGIIAGGHLAVFGAGPIGLLAMIVGKFFGARVTILDINPYRLEMARELGADYALDPRVTNFVEICGEVTGGNGFDAIVECSGSPLAVKNALDVVKKRGTIVQVGVCEEVTINLYEKLVIKELTIYGSRNCNAREYEEIVHLARLNPQIEKVITHRFKLTEAEEAFKVAASGRAGKVLLQPGCG